MILSKYVLPTDRLIADGEFDKLVKSNSIVHGNAISFLDSAKYLDDIERNPSINCIICLPEFVDHMSKIKQIHGIISSPNPRVSFFILHNQLCDDSFYALPTVETSIGSNCSISKQSYIDSKNVIIGDNVVIEEFVSIRGHCEISDYAVIRSGCQIGGSGYEFTRIEDETLFARHIGQVKIGCGTQIWHNCSIHKAVFPWDITVVGANVQINSNVHIDHGTKIQNGTKVCAGVTISGRVNVGEFCYIGPGAVLSNNISIGDSAKISLGAVVTKDVPPNQVVSGNFAIDHNLFINNLKGIIR